RVGAGTASDPTLGTAPARAYQLRRDRRPDQRDASQRLEGLDDHQRPAAALDHPRPRRPQGTDPRQSDDAARARPATATRRPAPEADPLARRDAGTPPAGRR